ncbi:NAD(P)/FAD-dependent oxidoreductase [Pectinatus sottacetonis]|uniref:NAD(P)/FAD-dependent oxidoreductase n=1 Tax=Pectinatus sottacetonis TaxID=1002795 RepID=UPI0018C724E9|nr:NAD(P)/FAD-dependent oxidoreductase [Pectinatus sottacetonis]
MSEKRPHVVIIGAGFGGIKAAKLLANEAVDVTLIDRNNYHLFQPLLYQVSTSMLSIDEIAYPTRAFFRKHKNVRFMLAHVQGFDPENKEVITPYKRVKYDYLIIAAGSTTNYFGMNNLAYTTYGMKTLREAIHIRNHVLHMFERAERESDPTIRKRMLTFVCVGGGPTGIEEAGSLSELIYNAMKDEYHGLDMNEVSIILIEATDKVLPMMPPDLRDETVKILQSKKVDVRLNTQVVDCSEDSLTLKDGSKIDTNTVIWAAGVKAVPVIEKLGSEVDRAGRVIVNKTLQVPGHPEIFAIGDCSHLEQNGRPLATIAPVATQGALVCVENIKKLIKGQTDLEEFVYHDVGSMATIGRGQAVMAKGSWKMKGFFAWCAWMLVHLMRLAGTHTNITVALKWAWNLLSGIRLGRIITNIPDNRDSK